MTIRSKARSFEKSQRSLSRSKTLSQLRRSERSGNRSKLKTKANEGRAKFRMRKPKPKKVYEGSKDLEDHLGIFSAVAEQEEWSMTHGKLQRAKLEILRVLVAKEILENAIALGKLTNLVKEHFERSFGAHTRSKLRKSSAPLVGFFKEIYHPLGLMDLQVTMGESSRSKTTLLEFAIVKCRSHYTVILGRMGIRSLGAVGSTIHSIVKFLTVNGNQRIPGRRLGKEPLIPQESYEEDRERGRIHVDSGGGYGHASIRHGAQVKNSYPMRNRDLLHANGEDCANIGSYGKTAGFVGDRVEYILHLVPFKSNSGRKRILMRHLVKFPVAEDDMDYEPYWPGKRFMDAQSLSLVYRITHLQNLLNPKAEALYQTRTIQLEFFKQEVSVRLKDTSYQFKALIFVVAPDIGSEKSRKTRDQAIPGKNFEENRGFRKKSTF
ncbi:hypothetical protein Tco_0477314 [Tanacetum coccineum]